MMGLDAGNLGWEAHRRDSNGADLGLGSDEAVESHQTHSAWMCRPKLKTLFRPAKVSGLQTLDYLCYSCTVNDCNDAIFV